ncbi:tetratricopeptide repeat protein [uncultured Fibrobacter sp.]|uniref:tetratricopeptide repeat protein n=1 Tax=uncultured Fibrobacter sp. TaxID=261512 RepID=UPI0025DD2817|nr:tetratricopeptide repeat protein [uncultured Fibrobacter sp.]
MAVTLDTLKKSIGKKKAKSMAFSWLADYEFMAGDVDNALARVDAGLQLYPGDIPGMLVRAKILFQQGKFLDCVEECKRVLEKDPFCLSAQKRMGDAYDQLIGLAAGEEEAQENTGNRNRCYRRVHDMDPLDTFWKEEYEAVPETLGAAAVAGAAALGEADFAMPDMDAAADVAAEPEMETASAETEAPAAEESDSLFDKSLDMDIDTPAEEPAPEFTLTEEPAEPAKPASPFSMADDDPFASLKSLGVEDDSVDESAMDTLENSLNSALDSAETDITLDEDAAPSEEISGNDVDSAFSNFFGDESDDLETESSQSSAPSSPFAQMDLPTSLDDEPVAPQPKDEDVFGSENVEDKPQSIDDAFGDIFGEDELPEELPSSAPALESTPAPEESSFGSGLFEKSADADMGVGSDEDSLKLDEPELEEPEADKPQSLDSAFNDIFGEDELPEEKPAEPAAEDASANEDEFSLGLDLPVEDAPATEAPAADDVLDLDSEDLTFGEEKASEDESLELPAEEEAVPEEPAAEETAVEEPAAEEPVVEETIAEEPAVEEPAVEQTIAEEPSVAEPEVADDGGIHVQSALDALFADDDELPEEHAPASDMPEAVAEDSLVESAPEEEKVESVADENKLNDEDSLSKEMGDAFSTLFSDDDDLPVDESNADASAELPEQEAVASQEDTGAAIEEAPLADPTLESDLDKSFCSLFGEDDSVAESEPAKAVPAEESAPTAEADVAQESVESSTDHESLESEFSGAFKELFNTDDDSLDEKESLPNNKGMDFLMSGDSDDEVVAGLVSDPNVPLDKLPSEIDPSRNTQTLAEIYFEQGYYDKALDMYRDLASKDPENEVIAKRLAEVQKAYDSKFGGEQNG